MKTHLGQWIEDNAGLFRYASDVKVMKESANKILLSGGVSAMMAGVYRTLYPQAEIDAVDIREDYLSDAKSECHDAIVINEPFNGYYSKDTYDIVLSLLAINTLDTRELTPYLYNIHDSLKVGGCLYLSFPDAVAPTAMEKNLYPAWYSMDEEIYMKYYMADDVVRALSIIGFDIKAIEADKNPELDHVVSVIAVKK